MDEIQEREWELLKKLFSEERLNKYLNRSDGEGIEAICLYQRNAQISAAFWELLSYLEVALRNTISLQLEKRYRELNCSISWVFDPIGEFSKGNAKANQMLRQAQLQVRRKGRDLVPSQIVSELPFGFWHLLTSKKFRFLWPSLAASFNGAISKDPRPINELLKELREFRNRIGHHHSLLNTDLTKRYSEIMQVAQLIDPQFGEWLSNQGEGPEKLSF